MPRLCIRPRRPHRRLVFSLAFGLPLALGLPLVACETVQQIGRVYLDATPEGRDLLDEWDHYARLAAKFKRYHDSGELDENAILDVLEEAGVIRPVPRPGPGTKRPPKPAPGREPGPPPTAPGGSWRWPLDAGVVSSEYGQRGSRPHRGIDIAAKTGTPIHAASAGDVIYADNKMRGYGNVVILRHDDHTTSLYAHASRFAVHRGQRVSRGATIASVGSTGRSTGPHVHFEIRLGERAVDPRGVLPKSRF